MGWEMTIFVLQQAAMLAPQRHRNHGENPEGIAGDSWAAPLWLGREDPCGTKPIFGAHGAASVPLCHHSSIPIR